MSLYQKWILGIGIILTLALVGCGSSETPKADVEKQEKIIEKEVTVPAKSVESSTPVSPSASSIPVDMPAQGIAMHLQVPPLKSEPASDPTITLTDVSEEVWKDLRELYILQYLHKKECLIWALQNPIPKQASEFLEKGYGVYGTPDKKYPSELELGLLKARVKDEIGVEDNLQKLERQFTGTPYFTMGYIASWYYCLAKKNDKAKALLTQSDLITKITSYDIDIPAAHLEALKLESEKAPLEVSPVAPKAVEPTESKAVEPPTESKVVEPPTEPSTAPAFEPKTFAPGETGEQPAGETGEQPAGESAEPGEPAGEFGEQPAGETGEQPAGETGEQPAEE